MDKVENQDDKTKLMKENINHKENNINFYKT